MIRYSLLETVRQFAAGRLADSGEETAVHGRLLRWALEVAGAAEAALVGAEEPGWSSRLSADQPCIRVALFLGARRRRAWRRDGTWPPGSPGGGWPPGGTAKQASS